MSLRAWEALDAELKSIVAHACAAEANFALAEMERPLNTEALVALTGQHRVQLRALPERPDRGGARGITATCWAISAPAARRAEGAMIRTWRSATGARERGRGFR